jgi:Fe(3+) dicitrate transport protein
MKSLFSIFILVCNVMVVSIHAQEKESKIVLDSLNSSEQLQAVLLSYNSVLDGFSAEQRSGSAQKITKKEIQQLGSLDPNRLFQRIAGLQVYEEDGFGLRPNISMRGTAPQRSSKINLMEDGVLAAPAPYSAPAAYYFPSLGRMDAVEVYKGSSQIEYGPNTSGGAINFRSAALPEKFTLEAGVSKGRFNTQSQQLILGNKRKDFSYMTQWLGYQSAGFKNIDGGGDSGFDKHDLLGKLQWTPEFLDKKHTVILKLGYAQENANETYLGLSQADFNVAAFRRYTASNKDQMRSFHQQFTLTHIWSVNKSISIKTTGYNNIFRRNWYKLDKVQIQDQTLGIATILANPEEFPLAYQNLTGSESADQSSLWVKANNRKYYSRGIQSQIDWRSISNPGRHLSLGIRWHSDAEDRFQWIDRYRLEDQRMNLIENGLRGSDANQINKANALSGFVLLTQKLGKLTLKPGIRIESIDLSSMDFGATNINRSGPAEENTFNNTLVFIPGLGFCLKWDNQTAFFGGLHKGFSPPGFTPDQKAEISWNNEFGIRHNRAEFNMEAVGFFNHYNRLLGSDLAAGGGYGNNQQFNAGKARVWGAEAKFSKQWMLSAEQKIELPLSLTYTWTQTRFLSSFESDNSLFGSVAPGNQMPYIAPHQGSIVFGITHPRWSATFNARYQSDQRSIAGQGLIDEAQKIPERTIVDFAVHYQITESWSTRCSVINALDQVYIAARHPAGLRPGHPRAISISLNYQY